LIRLPLEVWPRTTNALFDEKGDVFRSIEIVVVLSKHANPELSVLNQECFTLEIDRYRPSEFIKAAEILEAEKLNKQKVDEVRSGRPVSTNCALARKQEIRLRPSVLVGGLIGAVARRTRSRSGWNSVGTSVFIP